MASDVERFIRIEQYSGTKWSTVPLGERVRVWERVAAVADDGEHRLMFHIGYLDGVARGQRVTYLGKSFPILEVSTSTRLTGLEVTCRSQARPAAA